MAMRLCKKASKWHGAVEDLESRSLLTLLFLIPNGVLAAQQSNFSGPVATLIDLNKTAMPSDFNNPPGSVQIDWGDGSEPTTGQVVSLPTAGTFEIDGSHTYSQAGTFTTMISVSDQNDGSASESGSAIVVAPSTTPAPATSLTIDSNLITGTAGVPATNVTVATFLDPNLTDTTGDFVALINWGDGHTSSGSIQGGTGVFTVSGTNTYALGGTYTTTVTVVGTGTAPGATTMGVASISNPSESTSTFSFSGNLAPVVGNGPHAATGFTNTNQPTFSGTATPFSIVQIYARPYGVDTEEPLGETVTNSNGQWSLTAGPLLPGRYNVSAVVTPSSGSPSPMTSLSNNGLVHIDMVPKAPKAEIRRQKAMHHHHKPVKPPISHHPHPAPPKRLQV